MKAKYVAHKGRDTTEITDADCIAVIAPDGTVVQLQFRLSDGQISMSVNGRMLIEPLAPNVVRVSRVKK